MTIALFALLTLAETVDENEVNNAKLSHVLHQHVFDHRDKWTGQLHSSGEKHQIKPRKWQCDGH